MENISRKAQDIIGCHLEISCLGLKVRIEVLVEVKFSASIRRILDSPGGEEVWVEGFFSRETILRNGPGQVEDNKSNGGQTL